MNILKDMKISTQSIVLKWNKINIYIFLEVVIVETKQTNTIQILVNVVQALKFYLIHIIWEYI